MKLLLVYTTALVLLDFIVADALASVISTYEDAIYSISYSNYNISSLVKTDKGRHEFYNDIDDMMDRLVIRADIDLTLARRNANALGAKLKELNRELWETSSTLDSVGIKLGDCATNSTSVSRQGIRELINTEAQRQLEEEKIPGLDYYHREKYVAFLKMLRLRIIREIGNITEPTGTLNLYPKRWTKRPRYYSRSKIEHDRSKAYGSKDST